MAGDAVVPEQLAANKRQLTRPSADADCAAIGCHQPPNAIDKANTAGTPSHEMILGTTASAKRTASLLPLAPRAIHITVAR